MTVKNSSVALYHFCVAYFMNVWLYYNYEFSKFLLHEL